MQFEKNSNHRGVGIKQWRLIVRNLNFNTKEEDILQWANKYGKIIEVRLPKCKDKRFPDSCAGFCFIQFSRKADAEKARTELNFKELIDRKVAIDWAMDKDSWVTQDQGARTDLDVIKKINAATNINKKPCFSIQKEVKTKAIKKELKDEVKFDEQQDSKDFVQINNQDTIVEQKGVKNNEKNKNKAPIKDKRNLYLLRASKIRNDDNGMSNDDAKFRQRLVQLARNKLKNLTMFVSPTRLVIHNIPYSLTDFELLDICKATQQTKNSIIECRIMREVEGENEKKKPILGRSKGFGFVNFRDHLTALQCLKEMNNNPHIFKNERRPIVEFSIENLNALRTKEWRLRKSRGEEVHNFRGKKEIEEKYKCTEEPEALERTKREIMTGGRKLMPKKIGQKIRHKYKAKNQQKIAKNKIRK